MGTIVIEKMTMLILLIMVGYFCARAKWIDESFSQKASRIVLNVFTAAMIVSSAINARSAPVSGNLPLSFVLILVAFLLMGVVGWIFAKLLRFTPGKRGWAGCPFSL